MAVAYRQSGHHVVHDEQHGRERAGYGEGLVARLARDLTAWFGKRDLHQMQQFRLVWTPEKIVRTLSAQSGGALTESISSAVLAEVLRFR